MSGSFPFLCVHKWVPIALFSSLFMYISNTDLQILGLDFVIVAAPRLAVTGAKKPTAEFTCLFKLDSVKFVQNVCTYKIWGCLEVLRWFLV